MQQEQLFMTSDLVPLTFHPLSIYLTIYLSIYLANYLSNYRAIYLAICLSIYPST